MPDTDPALSHRLNHPDAHPALPHHLDRLDAYRVARAVLADVVRLSDVWPHAFASLADQARRAASSALLNLAEGACQPLGSAAKRRHYNIAYASCGELCAALDAAEILRLSPAAEVQPAQREAARLAALLGGLRRPRRR